MKKPIPLKLRSYIAVRDNGMCQICGKIGTLKITYFGYMAFERLPAWKSKEGTGGNRIYPGWMSFEIDHVKKEKDGGEASPENLRLSCRYCNRSRK